MTNDSPKGVKRYYGWRNSMNHVPHPEVKFDEFVNASDYDALAATVERLERERDGWKAQYEAGARAWGPAYKVVLDERDAIRAQLSQSQARERALEAALKSVSKGLRQALVFKDREMLDTAVRLSADECERAASLPTPAGGGV